MRLMTGVSASCDMAGNDEPEALRLGKPRMAAHQLVRQHATPAFELCFDNRERVISRAKDQRTALADSSFEDLQLSPAHDCERAGPRIERPNLALNHRHRFVPVDSAI